MLLWKIFVRHKPTGELRLPALWLPVRPYRWHGQLWGPWTGWASRAAAVAYAEKIWFCGFLRELWLCQAEGAHVARGDEWLWFDPEARPDLWRERPLLIADGHGVPRRQVQTAIGVLGLWEPGQVVLAKRIRPVEKIRTFRGYEGDQWGWRGLP